MRTPSRFIQCFQCLLGLSLVTASLAYGEDWQQHLGPKRNGHSGEQGLAKTWPEAGPKTLWSFPLGAGFGGPVVRDGEVYLLDRVNDERDVLRCIGRDSGKELWNVEFAAPGKISHNGSRTSPIVDEKNVYAVGMTGHFYAVSRETHQVLWHKDLAVEFPPAGELRWGYAQSPSLYKNLVVLAPQSIGAYVAAFDRQTGDLIWKSEGFGGVGYSTPVIHNIAGMDQAVMVSGGPTGGVMGVSLEDGRQLWRYDNWHVKIPIPHPTLLPEDRLFITGEYGAGSAIIQIVRDGEAFTVKELALLPDVESQIHPPLVIGDHLYLNCNGNKRDDGMACLGLDGSILWKTKDDPAAPRFERGGLIYADGMIIDLDGRTGMLHLINPSPEGYKELARANIFEGKEMWSPMALSDGKLLLRSMEELKCLDLRTP